MALWHMLAEAGYTVQLGDDGRGPGHLFDSVLPVGALLDPRTRSTLVPDAAVTIALPELRTERGAVQATRPMPARLLLFDVKGIHGGTSWYQCPRARDEQAGAVAQRAHSIALEYRRHAREVDERYHGPYSTQVLDRLDSFTGVRGLCVGHYGEASPDVHRLVDVAAAAAGQHHRRWGARTAAEARSFALQRYRRVLGLTFFRAMSRHLIRRVPFVGLDYELVRSQCDRFRRGERIFIGEVARPPPDLGLAPEVFYAFQAPRDRPDGAGAA